MALVVTVIGLVIQPYSRLERRAAVLIDQLAPPGTTVGAIDIGFPLTVEMTSLVVPFEIDGEQREISVEKLTGNLSLTQLVRGKFGASMTSDLFGGSVWLHIQTNSLRRGKTLDNPRLTIETRARDLDVAALCDFFEAPTMASGRCDADVEAQLNGTTLMSLQGKALVIGKNIEVPPIKVEGLMLPENHDGRLTATLVAKDESVLIKDLRFAGTAYDFSGNGAIRLLKPLEESALDCLVSAIFKEPFFIADERFSGRAAEDIVDTLVASQSTVFFKLRGTLGKPKMRLDPAASLQSLTQHRNR